MITVDSSIALTTFGGRLAYEILRLECWFPKNYYGRRCTRYKQIQLRVYLFL